jgi:hypothetical protein
MGADGGSLDLAKHFDVTSKGRISGDPLRGCAWYAVRSQIERGGVGNPFIFS